MQACVSLHCIMFLLLFFFKLKSFEINTNLIFGLVLFYSVKWLHCLHGFRLCCLAITVVYVDSSSNNII